MSLISRRLAASASPLCLLAALASAPAYAQNDAATAAAAQAAGADNAGGAGAVVAMPHPWQMGLQAPYSPVKLHVEWLNWWVSGLMVLVTAFVAVLLAYTLWRFNHRRNPNPSKVSHHTWLEVAWTLAPALILVAIAIPSFRLIYYEDRTQQADMTIKVTGHQWYWEYGYPDADNLHFDSYILPQDNLPDGKLRLLDVDNQLVLPVGKNVRILTTSADVIHSFFIPSLGVQRYAIPGRVVETWVRVDREGTFYGECNQICGTNHSAMPISIHALPPDQFQAWLKQAKTKFSDAGSPATPRFAAR